MTSTKALARIAGALYLIVAVLGGFAESVRTSVTVSGNAAATAANVVQHATLFRAAFVADLVDEAAFIGVGFVLYVLLRNVNQRLALAMLLLNVLSVGLQAANMTNHLAALMVATDARYGAPQTQVLFFLELHRQGYLVAQVFFGLYLLPLGYLVYRSRMFPRALGVVLMVGCAGYLGGVVSTFASPGFDSSLATPLGLVGGLAEIGFLLWLLAFGATEARAGAAPSTQLGEVTAAAGLS